MLSHCFGGPDVAPVIQANDDSGTVGSVNSSVTISSHTTA